MQKLVYIKEAIVCIKANKLRSFLALLGLLIGTAAVVSLVTIGFLAKNAMLEQFKNLGTQKIMLHLNNSDHLTNNQLSKLNLALENDLFNNNIIENHNIINSFYKNAYYNNYKLPAYQLGITASLQDSLKLSVKSGRLLSDHDNMRYFAVIGSDLENQIAEYNKENRIHSNLKVGDTITIDNNSFTIIGILNHWPVDPLFTYDINRSMLIPLNLSKYLSNNNMTEIYFDINKKIHPVIAENYLQQLLSTIIPNVQLQFSNAEQILEQLKKQAQILTILLGTIGGISLLVGAIGVMNIMLVSITERRAEIGIRMAIGARPNEIKLQFLFETICLTSMGGVLGTIVGIFIPYIIAYFAGWGFSLPIFAVIFGLFISLGVGIISGYYPAVKASKMLPIHCL